MIDYPLHDRASSVSYVPSPVDLRLLTALATYHYLTVDQLLRLFYRPGCRTGVQSRLKRLCDHGYALPLFLPRGTRAGSSPFVYTLASRGRRLLQRQGAAVPRRYRPSEQRALTDPMLRHTLACNDVYIALRTVCEARTDLALAQLIHERVLRPAPVEWEGRRRSVTPDGWADVRHTAIGAVYQYGLAWEVDRGTERQRAWAEKIAWLVRWAEGAYQEQFGTASLTIGVVATEGEEHARRLLGWTEATLRALDAEHAAPLFRITGLHPAHVAAARFMLDPHWAVPFSDTRVALIEGVGVP